MIKFLVTVLCLATAFSAQQIKSYPNKKQEKSEEHVLKSFE